MENLIDKDELLESFNASDFETYNDYSHTLLIMSPERYENRFEYERFCSCCGAMIYEKDDED